MSIESLGTWLFTRLTDIEQRVPVPRARSLTGPLLVAFVALVQIGGTAFAAAASDESIPPPGYFLLLAGVAALPFARRYPVPVLLVTLVTTVAYTGAGFPQGPVFVAFIVAFFAAVMAGNRYVAWMAMTLAFFGVMWLRYLLTGEDAPGLFAVLGVAAWHLVIGFGAELTRIVADRRREYRRTQEIEGRRRASEERLLIARELHDVLAHHISLINVRAGVALHLGDRNPQEVANSLAAIRDASAEALTDLRSVIDLLTRNGENAPRAPSPGLAQLDSLIARAQDAGLTLEKTVVGTPRPLPAAVDAAAYRIVQEAITNVTRHADASAASVRLGYGEAELTLEVADRGRNPGRAWREGNGILGMRERAGALGGELEAGFAADGGFHVRARLPLESSP